VFGRAALPTAAKPVIRLEFRPTVPAYLQDVG
jgi:hypothetical protein